MDICAFSTYWYWEKCHNEQRAQLLFGPFACAIIHSTYLCMNSLVRIEMLFLKKHQSLYHTGYPISVSQKQCMNIALSTNAYQNDLFSLFL